MKPQKQTLSAVGSTDWLPVDWRGDQYGIGVGANVSSGGALTYSVEYTFDNPYDTVAVDIARVTTVATVTFAVAHGKSVGDSITVTETREDNLAGTFAIATVPSDLTLTYTVSNTGSAAESAQAAVFTVFADTNFSAISASANALINTPVSMIRTSISAFTSGNLTTNYIFLSRGA